MGGKSVLGHFGMVLGQFHTCERVICRGGDGVGGHLLEGDAETFAVRSLCDGPVTL